MDGIRQYILSVAAAAILCAVLREMLPGKGMTASLFRLISGIFIAFVVISPIKNVELSNIAGYLDDFSQEGQALAAQGSNLSAEAMADIIKRETEAYILDKARSLSASVTAEVTLGTDGTPESVRVTGDISPYAKSQLCAVLEEDLGIPKENQTWTD